MRGSPAIFRDLFPTLALVALVALGGQATADAGCAAIPDDAARLDCYDRLYRDAQGPPAWAVWETHDPLSGATGLRAALPAEAPFADRFGDPARAHLYLACEGGGLAVWVRFGGAYLDPRDGGTRMTYRLDGDPPKARDFQLSQDRRGLGAFTARSAGLLLDELEGRRRLVVRATPFRTSTVTAAFDLSGLARPLARVRAACE